MTNASKPFEDLADLPAAARDPLDKLRRALTSHTGADGRDLRLQAHQVRTHTLTANKTVRYRYTAVSKRRNGKTSAMQAATNQDALRQAEALAATLNADIETRLRRAAGRLAPGLDVFPAAQDLLPDAAQRQWGVDHACARCATTGNCDCGNCKARGILVCGDCTGAGQRPCSTCDGAGTCTCPQCKGSTRHACTACDGWGKNTCAGCGGVGKRRVFCAACSGTGKTQVTVSVRDPGSGASASARSVVDCPGCRGAGYRFPTCGDCSGQGSRQCPACRSGTVSCSACIAGKLPCMDCAVSGMRACAACDATGALGCPACKRSTKITCTGCGGFGWQHDLVEVSCDAEHDKLVSRTDGAAVSPDLARYLAGADAGALGTIFSWRVTGAQHAGNALTIDWGAVSTEAALTLDLYGQAFTPTFHGPAGTNVSTPDLIEQLVSVVTRSDDLAIAAALRDDRDLETTLHAALDKPAILQRLADDVYLTQSDYARAIKRVAVRGAGRWNLAWGVGAAVLAALYLLRPSSFTGDWAVAGTALWAVLYGWAAWWPKRARAAVLRVVAGPGRDAALVASIDRNVASRADDTRTVRIVLFAAIAGLVLIPAEAVVRRHAEAKAALAAEAAAIHAEAVRINDSNARSMREYDEQQRARGARHHKARPGQ